RRPMKIGSASLPRYPALMRRCCTLPRSASEFGAKEPRRFSALTIAALSGGGALEGTPCVSSPRRRSIAAVAGGDIAMAAAVTSSDTNRNASSGSSRVTSHLDPDHAADPQVADRLHDDGGDQHQLP